MVDVVPFSVFGLLPTMFTCVRMVGVSVSTISMRFHDWCVPIVCAMLSFRCVHGLGIHDLCLHYLFLRP